jgi:hypothetical protein
LKVLDYLNFACTPVVERLDLRGYAGEPSKSRGTEPPCSNDQLEMVTHWSHEDWLQEHVRANTRCELVEVVEALARIRRGFADALKGQGDVLGLDCCGARRHVRVLSLRWGVSAVLRVRQADEEVGVRDAFRENPRYDATLRRDVQREIQILPIGILECRRVDHLTGNASLQRNPLRSVIR